MLYMLYMNYNFWFHHNADGRVIVCIMEINNTRQNVHAGLGESTRCPTTSENIVR